MTAVHKRVLAGLVTGFAATLAAIALLQTGPAPSQPQARSSTTGSRTLSVPFVRVADGTTSGHDYVAATFAGAVRVDADGVISYALPGGTLLRERAREGGPCDVDGGVASRTRVHVFRGKDADGWRRGLTTHETVRVSGLAPGVDLEVAAGARNVEKRFHVAPGTDVNSIAMRFEGTTGLAIGPDGSLEVGTAQGAMTFTPPVAFQESPRGRTFVPARYVVAGDTYGFEVEDRDPTRPLVIDPLIAATYLGGATDGENLLNDEAHAIAHFAQSVYVVGSTQADIFPDGFDEPYAYQDHYGGGWTEAFVCRLSEDLSTVEAMTFLGGDGTDAARDVVVDQNGVWVVGETDSGGFPTTFGAFQPSIASEGYDDAFVTHLSHDLETLMHSTFLGGEANDGARGIAISPEHGIVVVGRARSVDTSAFVPELALPHQRVNNGVFDTFVTRLAPDLGSVTAGTMYGGSFGDDVEAVAWMGADVLICGSTSSTDLPLTPRAFDSVFEREQDGFVARFDTALETLLGATYLGGEEAEYPYDECLDVGAQGGDVVVCGATASADFPTTTGAFDETPNGAGAYMPDDGFVVRLSPDMTTLRAGTFVGGSSSDGAERMALHEQGIVIVGRTSSADFPVPAGSEDDDLDGNNDAYVFVLTHDLSSVIEARFLGSELWEGATGVALSEGVAFVTGTTVSRGFPTTSGAFDETFNDELNRTDCFVASFDVFEGGVTPPPTEIDAYILPKRLDVRHKTKRPEKSWLNSGGWFDTGSGAVDWTKPGSLIIGDRKFDIPGLAQLRKNKQWWEWHDDDMYFRIKPSRYGSSKGKFKLKWTHADVMDIPIDEPLVVHFRNGDVDAMGEVALQNGRFQHGRQRGALIQPPLALYSCRTVVKGGDKDSIRARLGLRTDEGVPHECPPLTIALNEQFTDTVETDLFKLRKRKFVFKGPKGGISKATVDYGKEKLAIVGKKIDVGTFTEGPQAVSVLVQLGDEALLLRVRMVRAGRRMRY